MSTNLSLGESIPTPTAVRDPNAVSDIGSQELLSALVAFMKPVIQKCAASPVNNESYHSDDQLITGLEGKNLLSALTAFVTAAVHVTFEVSSKQENISEPYVVVNEVLVNEVPVTLTKEVPQSEMEIKALSAARAYVFNKMPIRLLSFDQNGSNIQLIGRNQMVSFICDSVLHKTQLPEFQLKWAEAEKLEDSDIEVLSWKHRSNKMKELLAEVTETNVNYAILSHTWIRNTPGDITFQDWTTREQNPQGNAKIIKFCKVAALDHDVTLGWIDSVCINKESSSELDESIRSMYNWYKRASICITYLSETSSLSDAHNDSWFTRGWTLQELLAPAHSIFYNQNWKQLGSSKNSEIQAAIKKANKITKKELELSWNGNVNKIPLSRRMQMACERQVTREEDSSYSLMGILGVDISIAYGEGASRAFSRLVSQLFNTEKNIIDLFNRSFDEEESLLPSSLESYQYRDEWWDYSNEGTSLDEYLPLEPIIPTHLGMHISLLLAPGLLSNLVNNDNYTPKGDFSAAQSVTFYLDNGRKEKLLVLLLDSRLYTGDLDNLRNIGPIALPDEIKSVIRMYGIVNFGSDTSGNILLPKKCIALNLHWDGIQEGNFTPSENVSILSGPPFGCTLKSKKGFKCPKGDLEKHGMQLVSLYL